MTEEKAVDTRIMESGVDSMTAAVNRQIVEFSARVRHITELQDESTQLAERLGKKREDSSGEKALAKQLKIAQLYLVMLDGGFSQSSLLASLTSRPKLKIEIS